MFTREELENMTVRQLRLIDVKEVPEEKMIQEILNKKLSGMPMAGPVSREQTPDFKNPREEAEYQKMLDERAAKAKERMFNTPNLTNTPESTPEASSPEDDKTINQPAQNTPSEDLVDHTLTQEDLDDNPELVTEGLKVGDLIQIPKVKDEGQPKELEKMSKTEITEYAKTLGVEFGPEIKNQAQRIESVKRLLAAKQ